MKFDIEEFTFKTVKKIMNTKKKITAVRCIDCIYWDHEGIIWQDVGFCELHEKTFCDTDFCAYGKKEKKCSKDVPDVDLHG